MTNWFTTKKLNENVYGIGEFQHFEEVISYLIVGKNNALLFDTGMGIRNIKDEVSKITDKEIIIINSHTHFDHIGGNHLFGKSLIYDSEFAIKNASGIQNNELHEYVVKENFFHSPPPDFDENTYRIKSFKFDLLHDRQIINLEPFTFEIIHTPGHSPDSICLYEKERSWLFGGDSLYNGPIYLQMDESNVGEYIQSINKLSTLKVSTIFAGHNDYFLDPISINQIQNALRENRTGGEIFIKDRLSLQL